VNIRYAKVLCPKTFLTFGYKLPAFASSSTNSHLGSKNHDEEHKYHFRIDDILWVIICIEDLSGKIKEKIFFLIVLLME
jgi:hypothetical protein